jgi:hypothetical protein
MRPGRVRGARLRPIWKWMEAPPDPTALFDSAPRGNAGRDRAEVSRGHNSQTPTLMGGTG